MEPCMRQPIESHLTSIYQRDAAEQAACNAPFAAPGVAARPRVRYARGMVAGFVLAVVMVAAAMTARADEAKDVWVLPVAVGVYIDPTSGVYYAQDQDGCWWESDSLDMAGGKPVGRGKRVRIHGSGLEIN